MTRMVTRWQANEVNNGVMMEWRRWRGEWEKDFRVVCCRVFFSVWKKKRDGEGDGFFRVYSLMDRRRGRWEQLACCIGFF